MRVKLSKAPCTTLALAQTDAGSGSPIEACVACDASASAFTTRTRWLKVTGQHHRRATPCQAYLALPKHLEQSYHAVVGTTEAMVAIEQSARPPSIFTSRLVEVDGGGMREFAAALDRRHRRAAR